MATNAAPSAAVQESDTITIRVPSELARAYHEAPPEERRKWQLVVGLSLRSLITSTPETLNQLIRDMSQRASAAGLTEAELEAVLADSDDEGGR